MHVALRLQQALGLLSVWCLVVPTACAEPCPPGTGSAVAQDNPVVTQVCDAQGALLRRVSWFEATGLPAAEEDYQAGKLVKKTI